MRFISLFILASLFMAPLGILNYMVMPEVENMKNVYQNMDQTAAEAAGTTASR